MKMVMITQDFPPDVGGIQTYSYELANRLHRQFDEFHMIAPLKWKSHNVDKKLPYPVHRLLTPNTWLPFMAKPGLSLISRFRHIDVTFHSQWQTVASTCMLRDQGILKGIFSAAHGRELLFNPFTGCSLCAEKYERIRKKMLLRVDHFFAVSNYTAGLLEQSGVDTNRISVVYNGTDPDHFTPMDVRLLRSQLDLKEGPVILTASRLIKRKGIDTVLNALPEVLTRHPGLIYLIVGDGPDRKRLEQLVSELRLKEHVRFTGLVGYKDIPKYYNLCDLFVMVSRPDPPNKEEAFGISYLEANACAKPVIGSCSGGIPDAIVDGTTGYLADPFDVRELANRLIQMLGDPLLLKNMGQKGRERILNEMNWDSSSGQIVKRINSHIRRDAETGKEMHLDFAG